MEDLLKELNQIQAIADLRRELSKTVAVLRGLKSGLITLDNLEVNGDDWRIVAIAPVEPISEPPPDLSTMGIQEI